MTDSLNINELLQVLDQQDKRIKELESQVQTQSQLKSTIDLLNKENEKLTAENQRLTSTLNEYSNVGKQIEKVNAFNHQAQQLHSESQRAIENAKQEAEKARLRASNLDDREIYLDKRETALKSSERHIERRAKKLAEEMTAKAQSAYQAGSYGWQVATLVLLVLLITRTKHFFKYLVGWVSSSWQSGWILGILGTLALLVLIVIPIVIAVAGWKSKDLVGFRYCVVGIALITLVIWNLVAPYCNPLWVWIGLSCGLLVIAYFQYRS